MDSETCATLATTTATPRRWFTLSARTAVLANALPGIGLGFAIAAIGWKMLVDVKSEVPCALPDVSTLCTSHGTREVLWIGFASIYTLLCLVSIAGLIAALQRRRQLASVYTNLLAFHLVASLAVGVTTVVLYAVIYAPRPFAFTPTFVGLLVAQVVMWLWDILACVAAYRLVCILDRTPASARTITATPRSSFDSSPRKTSTSKPPMPTSFPTELSDLPYARVVLPTTSPTSSPRGISTFSLAPELKAPTPTPSLPESMTRARMPTLSVLLEALQTPEGSLRSRSRESARSTTLSAMFAPRPVTIGGGLGRPSSRLAIVAEGEAASVKRLSV